LAKPKETASWRQRGQGKIYIQKGAYKADWRTKGEERREKEDKEKEGVHLADYQTTKGIRQIQRAENSKGSFKGKNSKGDPNHPKQRSGLGGKLGCKLTSSGA
jgi:hypothetical protein